MFRELYLPAVVGGGYGEFWRCRARYRVVKGGKASKKSSTAALWYIYHLMKYPDANLLVVRAVMRTHLDSTFAQLQWAIRQLHVEHLWRANRTEPMLTYLPTGQRILFRGMDCVDKLASTTVERGKLCWVWVEEAFEIAKEADFDKLDLTAPRGEVEEPLFKQTTLTFNPWSEHHWLKSRFFDRTPPDCAVFTTTYRCNEFLDQSDRAVYEQMRHTRPQLYAVAGLGEWGVAEGLIYDNWRVEEFDKAALRDARYRHVFGLDYGYTNDPTAFIAAAVDDGEKTIYLYDEHYERRMLNQDIARMIVHKGYQKERIRADSAEPKSNEDLRRLGISRLRPARKGRDSVRAGIARLQEYAFVVHPSCVHTIAELRAYVWGPERDASGRPLPLDSDNHLMDALRYAMEDLPRGRPGARVTRPAASRALLGAGQWDDGG